MTQSKDSGNNQPSTEIQQSLNAEIAEESLTTAERLNLETAKLAWKDLELFFAKGNLIRVEKSKDLIEVAALIADNHHQEIEILIANQQIEFMTPNWVKTNCKRDSKFWTVVVAPYVVCQPE